MLNSLLLVLLLFNFFDSLLEGPLKFKFLFQCYFCAFSVSFSCIWKNLCINFHTETLFCLKLLDDVWIISLVICIQQTSVISALFIKCNYNAIKLGSFWFQINFRWLCYGLILFKLYPIIGKLTISRVHLLWSWDQCLGRLEYPYSKFSYSGM